MTLQSPCLASPSKERAESRKGKGTQDTPFSTVCYYQGAEITKMAPGKISWVDCASSILGEGIIGPFNGIVQWSETIHKPFITHPPLEMESVIRTPPPRVGEHLWLPWRTGWDGSDHNSVYGHCIYPMSFHNKIWKGKQFLLLTWDTLWPLSCHVEGHYLETMWRE